MPGKTRTILNSGSVAAAPATVMAWWFHPDRSEDLRDRLNRVGARDVSVDVSQEGDIRVVTTSYVNNRGNKVHSRRERPLTSEGTAPPSGDRFISESIEVLTMETRSGHKLTRTCNGRMAFIPQPDGSTEVVSIHRHALVGGTWAERLGAQKGDGKLQTRQFAEVIESCRAATSP
jgi:hypothetical protein